MKWQQVLDDELKQARFECAGSWSDYVFEFANWKNFVTLTFEKEYSRETVWQYWRTLVQMLNSDLYGHHYTRLVGHSYFSYCLAFEKQERGAYHLHALVAGRLNFKMIHDFWGHIAGFAWISVINNKLGCARYVSKYVIKDGDIVLYRPPSGLEIKPPAFLPMWYRT
jgi:hypothetical protein